MATNAFGKDFYVGQRWRSKDNREGARHIVIANINNGRATCHPYMAVTKQTLSRKTRISLKSLATRWEICNDVKPCSWCAPTDQG